MGEAEVEQEEGDLVDKEEEGDLHQEEEEEAMGQNLSATIATLLDTTQEIAQTVLDMARPAISVGRKDT